MEAYETIHPDYVKGFNEGYTISKHLPNTATKISLSLPQSDRGNAFRDGRVQFILDKEKEHYPQWLRQDKSQDLGEDTDRSKDKGKDMMPDL